MSAVFDRRDAILARLEEILKAATITISNGTIPAGNYVRNRNQLPKELVPGVIQLDADETRDPRFPSNQGRGGPPGPGMMRMTPEVYVVLDQRKPNNLNVGPDLNLARAEIIRLVYRDTTLQKLTGDSGTIQYDGCVTDLARNRVMEGQMGLSITFVYPFVPGEFAEG